MPRGTLIFDGLWHCLCPAFNHTALKRPVLPLISRKRAPTTCISATLRTSARRCNGSTANQNQINGESDNNNDSSGSESTESRTAEQSHANTKGNQQDKKPVSNLKFKRVILKKRKSPGVPEDLEKRTTENLENRLQDLVAKRPSITSATQFLRVLIRDRHVRPEVRHYRALILANTDAERGSPENVRNLLKEMEHNGIPADSGTLHAALKVSKPYTRYHLLHGLADPFRPIQALAVHPDYLLRQEILRTLRDRWLTLSPAGWHYVVAGLIREHQFELAMDYIEQMERKGIPVDAWLHSILVYNLCDAEEFDEVLKLMRSRADQGHEMSLNLWFYVLDVASEALHHETTKYIWKHVVELGFLKPSYGVCSNVLTIASRTGDTELATSVFRFLAETEVPFSLDDYEKLVETYVMAGDLYTAFDTLCTMQKSGIALEESSTRAILTYMIRSKTNPRDAWAMLKQLKAQKRDIPLGCANVVIELCEHAPIDDTSAVEDAIAFYKELYSLCPSGANVATYNSLITTCRRAKDTKACMFAVKEMAALGVMPDTTTFERLILMCLDSGNYRSAYMYFQDLLDRKLSLSEAARAEIRQLCQGCDDEFALRLSLHSHIRSGVPIRKHEVGDETPQENSEGGKARGRRRAISRAELLARRARQRMLRREWRRAKRKERRKRKRRLRAIARGMEEEGWLEWEAGGLNPSETSEQKGQEENTETK